MNRCDVGIWNSLSIYKIITYLIYFTRRRLFRWRRVHLHEGQPRRLGASSHRRADAEEGVHGPGRHPGATQRHPGAAQITPEVDDRSRRKRRFTGRIGRRDHRSARLRPPPGRVQDRGEVRPGGAAGPPGRGGAVPPCRGPAHEAGAGREVTVDVVQRQARQVGGGRPAGGAARSLPVRARLPDVGRRRQVSGC